MRIFLALDIGTTSVKGCAFDESFNRVASFHREYALQTPCAHFVEMDPDDYWAAVAGGIRDLLAGGLKAEDIACVTFTTQGETMIPVDATGSPLSKAVVWLDDRAQEEARRLSAEIDADTFYRTTGIPELGAATPVAKLQWHARQAGFSPKVYKYLLLEDYLILRMTGKFVTEQSLLSSTGYFDIVNRRYWPEALRACGVREGQLPQILPSGVQAGAVTQEAALQTGLRAGTPVITGAMDQVCAAIGAGNVQEGILAENTGTCLAVTATIREPRFSPDRSVPVYAHFDQRFLLLAYNPTAAMVLKWFKDQFMGEYAENLKEGQNIYDALTALAAEAPALCGGVTLIPHFSGRLFPEADGNMRGAFVGLNLGTTRADCIRAILEGVAFMLRQSVQAVQDLGATVREIRAVGGASVSPLWNQIKADVSGFPITAMRESESTALGAAMLGALGLGLEAGMAQLSQRHIAGRHTYMPEAAMRQIYDRGFARFEEINRRLSGLRVDMDGNC